MRYSRADCLAASAYLCDLVGKYPELLKAPGMGFTVFDGQQYFRDALPVDAVFAFSHFVYGKYVGSSDCGGKIADSRIFVRDWWSAADKFNFSAQLEEI